MWVYRCICRKNRVAEQRRNTLFENLLDLWVMYFITKRNVGLYSKLSSNVLFTFPQQPVMEEWAECLDSCVKGFRFVLFLGGLRGWCLFDFSHLNSFYLVLKNLISCPNFRIGNGFLKNSLENTYINVLAFIKCIYGACP